ncbi:MAG: right-handed parallel beta-helix repeat-containing protein [Acidobacteria bacterium]|nr:right-handed parallel beta-helix repeat-containing protein [Acidobacteriota bacterium]
MDIYLNLAATSTNDTRFDFTSAVNQPSGPHRRDFAFNAGFYNDTDVTGSGPRFVVSASNNTNRSGAFPKNPGRSPFTIAATGWYTFLHTFRNNGSGILAVDLSILNMSGTVLNTWTLSDPTDTIGVNVGGNRYGWFANNEFSFLAIDNSTRANLAPDPTVVYVDDNWIGLAPGTDPDGAGPATSIGYDAFATVQGGVDGVAASGQVIVYAGTYVEDVTINKSITVTGAGVATTTISGAIGGLGSTVAIAANNVEFKGFKITRQGNSAATWNDPLNSAGISIQGQAITGANIHDNLITQNRTGIDINNSNGHTVRNNVITDNRTGMIFRNQTDNLTVVENEITNNWTVGVLFLDGSGGTNSPVQTALNSVFFNNNISANWYGQIVDRQSGGALPAPGTNIKNFSGNWLGTASPFISTANSAEPGYAAQVPFTVPGGTAMPPGGQPDVLGPASANFDITPYLTTGTDTNVETTPGRGTYGFQGDFSGVMANTIKVNSTGATSSTPTAADNDYTRVNSAVQAAMSGDTIILNGTFNWAETNAALSWSKGSNGLTGDLDDYSILVPANRNNVTFTATSLGAATIQGPGDLPTVNLEGVFFFDSLNGGKNQGWTISNIRFVDFDLAIGMFFDSAGAVDAFKDTKILNNYIKIAKDLNATVAPADVNQNIGIHFSFGKNQTISGNTIDFDGDGVSDSANNNFSSQVGMQSNTSGGDVYDGLQITNNILRVLNAQSANPQTIRGIWENSHGHLGNVTVSGNSFTNLAAGNNPATNLQVGFRVTSHSSPTTTVKYQNNTVSGANTGFEWIAGSDFAGNQPVQLISNTITGNNKGVLIQSNGTALLKFNRILGNLVSGVENVTANAINAENNWWGCNFGPGVGGANCTGTPNGVTNTGGGSIDSNPWLVLGLTAAPNPIAAGGMSNLTASLKKNSDGVDTSLMGMGTFPDGVTAGFTGTLGTVAPPSAPTSGGMAMSVYTNTANGTATITTTVDQQTVILSLLAACPTITISPAAIPDAFKGTAYSQTFTAAGAISAVTWSVSAGTLPAGLTLSPAGVLSGTPTATGNFTFTVSATDANNCPGTQTYTLPVHVETAGIADPALCTGPGGAVDVTATVTNGAGSSQPATFTASLPAGLLAVPGTCSANVGICNVVNGSTVTWSGNLAGNQTVTIKYKAQIGDQVVDRNAAVHHVIGYGWRQPCGKRCGLPDGQLPGARHRGDS